MLGGILHCRVEADLFDVSGPGDDAFGEEQACGEVEVVPGGAHGHAQRAHLAFAIDNEAEADFERFFGGDNVAHALAAAVADTVDLVGDEAGRAVQSALPPAGQCSTVAAGRRVGRLRGPGKAATLRTQTNP